MLYLLSLQDKVKKRMKKKKNKQQKHKIKIKQKHRKVFSIYQICRGMF